MAFGKSGKFLDTPERVTSELAKLDPLSILGMVESGVIDKEGLKKSLSLEAWGKVIKHSAYGGSGVVEMGGVWYKVIPHEKDVADLVKILKMMQLEEPTLYLYLQPLLSLICEFRPVDDITHGMIGLIWPSHPDKYHLVPTDAFMLLEEAEGALGTAEQSIESISEESLESAYLSAISSRISRQRERVKSIAVGTINIRIRSDAQAFSTLMQAEKIKFKHLKISGGIGEAGWQVLAGALQGKHIKKWSLVCTSKQGLSEAGKEAAKDIWDAVWGGFAILNTEKDLGWYYGGNPRQEKALCVDKAKYDWEQAWTRLKKMSSLSEDEFTAEFQKQEREGGGMSYKMGFDYFSEEDESEGETQPQGAPGEG